MKKEKTYYLSNLITRDGVESFLEDFPNTPYSGLVEMEIIGNKYIAPVFNKEDTVAIPENLLEDAQKLYVEENDKPIVVNLAQRFKK